MSYTWLGRNRENFLVYSGIRVTMTQQAQSTSSIDEPGERPTEAAATETAKKTARLLVMTATYNEIENLPRLVDAIFAHAPDCDLLVVDDNSPDGTGRWCDERAAEEPRLKCLHREGKLGLGSAIIAGMQYAIDNDYDYLLNLDADFSHAPESIPDLVEDMDPVDGLPADVMIGSRYVPGGGIEGWPLRRHVMSRGVNCYARRMLSLKPKDTSGGFRCYRVKTLRNLDFDEIRSFGYAFQEEVLWRLAQIKARIGETPITFVDRQHGTSKINTRESISAVWIIFRLGMTNWIGL